jgi:hypothetical protein
MQRYIKPRMWLEGYLAYCQGRVAYAVKCWVWNITSLGAKRISDWVVLKVGEGGDRGADEGTMSPKSMNERLWGLVRSSPTIGLKSPEWSIIELVSTDVSVSC